MSQPFNTDSTVARVRGYLVDLQARIIGALEAVEGAGGACAVTDPWHKAPGEPLQGDGAPSWPARRSRPWACRWFFTRAIPMCPPCT